MLTWQLNFKDVYGGYLQDQAIEDLFLRIIRFRVFRNPGKPGAALKYHYH
jgi:hypothetical protein